MLIDHAAAKLNPTKHTLVVLVENKPGVLNRVSSLFRRRSFNIDSLTVGETDDPTISRMTIVVDASKTSANLVRTNLMKTVPVIDVIDITALPMVARELALIKVNVENTAKRSELKHIVDMYHARVEDVSKNSIIIEITGDEQKVDSLLKLVADYGVLEVVRTGRVAMTRG